MADMKELLNEKERKTLSIIQKDLEFLFEKEEILPNEIDKLLEQLNSEEAKRYITYLKEGSKPEIAMREALFSGGSVLSKYLFGEISPEVNIGEGFIDYLIKVDRNKIMLLELKPLFENQFDTVRGQRVFKKIKQVNLVWEQHKPQVVKYIQSQNSEFVILTNLKIWSFFSRISLQVESKPFLIINFDEFDNDYKVIGSLTDYLERKESHYHREGLDKKFFESLKEWVKAVAAINFTAEDKTKMELIVSLINKFIFVQTLDDYGIIDFKWLETTWNHFAVRWGAKGKLKILQEFFKELDSWFFEYYDTELFKVRILDYINSDSKNIEKLYECLEFVIGLTAWQKTLGGYRGIFQYKFKYIDEDIFGKAYETFLAEIKKERGIYYTPKLITKYVVENTVGKTFREISGQLCNELEKEDFDKAKNLAEEFVAIKILDSSCGSGSFLIKALRCIWQEYTALQESIAKICNKYEARRPIVSGNNTSLFLPDEIRAKVDQCNELKNMLGFNNSRRDLISKIILRHVYGNDLDRNAIDVAKVNLWLEAIKLAPQEFRYDRLPAETNHILPDLEMNLGNGDTLVGLPEEIAVDYLVKNHKEELIELFNLRNKYLDNPRAIELVEKIEEVKGKIRIRLNEEFKNYIISNNFPSEIFGNVLSFHWPLEFWYLYFSEDGNPLSNDLRGVDVLIGNPPYVDYRSVEPISIHNYFKKVYESSRVPEKYNLYILFIEKGLKLLKKNGRFGYINPLQWMGSLMGAKLREYLLNNYHIAEIDDLSLLGVFEEPTLSNLGLFFLDKHAQKDRIKIGYKIASSDDIAGNAINFVFDDLDNLIIGPDKVIMLDPDSMVNSLIKELEKNVKLNEVIELEWGTSQAGYGQKKITKEQYDKLSSSQKKSYVPLVQTGDLNRHCIFWQGEYIDKSIYSSAKQKQFSEPKLIFSRRAPTIECAYDEQGFYLGKVAFSLKFKKRVSPYFLVGVFNSNLIDFYFKKVYETIHPGGNLRLDIPYLNQLPVKLSQSEKETKLANNIVKLTSKIVALKTARQKYIEIWNEGFKRFNKVDRTLHEILNNDAELIKHGKSKDSWTNKVTFYPFQNDKQLENFNQIKAIGDAKKSVIKIYGIHEDNRSNLIYEIVFNDKNLMQHVYFSIISALKSGVRIRNLGELFKKTSVPIVPPDIKTMQNIFEKIKSEFVDWLRHEKITEVKPEIAQIDQDIVFLDSEINNLVFALYRLNRDEVKLVALSSAEQVVSAT